MGQSKPQIPLPILYSALITSSNVRQVHFLLLACLHITVPFPSSGTSHRSCPWLILLQTVKFPYISLDGRRSPRFLPGRVPAHVVPLSTRSVAPQLARAVTDLDSPCTGVSPGLDRKPVWQQFKAMSSSPLLPAKNPKCCLLLRSTFISQLVFYSEIRFTLKMAVARAFGSEKGKSV